MKRNIYLKTDGFVNFPGFPFKLRHANLKHVSDALPAPPAGDPCDRRAQWRSAGGACAGERAARRRCDRHVGEHALLSESADAAGVSEMPRDGALCRQLHAKCAYRGGCRALVAKTDAPVPGAE